MTTFNDTRDALTLLKTRRSIVAKEMTGEGPTDTELEEMLQLAARVPDHGKLAPWRFIVFSGEARSKFGALLAERQRELNPDFGEDLIAYEAERFLRAGQVVCVVSTPTENIKIPVWEQELSAGAVCQNMLIAATAMGFAVQWLTEWYAFDERIRSALRLEPSERVAGFVYISHTHSEPNERPRPDVSSITEHWTD